MATTLMLLDGDRGIFIPRDFEKIYGDQFPDDLQDERATIKDPNNGWYWDAWRNICDHLVFEIDGVKYTLLHDTDLFAVPEGESPELLFV